MIGEQEGTFTLGCSLPFPEGKVRVSIHEKGDRHVVRWRQDGKQRSRAFDTRTDADKFERELVRKRDRWRDAIGGNLPELAVPLREADHGDSYLVTEKAPQYVMPGQAAALSPDSRQIHEGWFLTIADADAYRRSMPDADDLAITVCFDRYPLRDLDAAEIAAGARSPDTYEALRQRIIEERRT